MSTEERDAAYHTLITCDGKGKEAKAEALRQLIEWHRKDADLHGYTRRLNEER
jgi:hypothetical protein